ncbi:HD family phosphohydrolase [Laspinema olomoucense]|uniref:HDIG domain-containing protein n=1 Tax=Laspinema olomoucense D3b TaxID=2953688 RepID=A0ABT2NE38_9CYAN|nr:HDIG domain-containing metalloprotein [Laspinema sp. D3b]MCT7980966.1 HDIG domain-containing protein [Laspinema sp. D3b]
MRSIQMLTRQLEQWGRDCANIYSRNLSDRNGRKRGTLPQGSPPSLPHELPASPAQGSTEPRAWTKGLPSRMNTTVHSPVAVLLAVTCLTATIGQRFYNQPQLGVGTIAPETFIAPEDARVEDTKTTEDNRRAARIGSSPVLMIDRPVSQQIEKVLQRVLDEGTQLRQVGGQFPFVDTTILSTSTQLYLRQAQEWEYSGVVRAAGEDAPMVEIPDNSLPGADSSSPADWAVERGLLTDSGQQAVMELQGYRKRGGSVAFSTLIEEISQARQTYGLAVAAIADTTSIASTHIYSLNLFELSDEEWIQTQLGLHNALKRMLSQGIPPGLPKNILQMAVMIQLEGQVPQEAVELSENLLLEVLQPNLIKDLERTRVRAEQAALEVKPVFVSVEQGEVIIEQGETISQSQFVLLDRFDMSRREINWVGLFGFGGTVTIAVGIFWVAQGLVHPKLRRRDRTLVLLLSLTAPLLISLGIPYTTLPAVGLLLGSFYGSLLSGTVVGLLSVLLPLGIEIEWTYLLANAAAGLISGILAGRMRSREELAMVGGVAGLTQGGVYLIGSLIPSATAGTIWYTILGAAGIQAIAGVSWSIVALGLSPYLEHLFDLVTPIRLAELANPNRPLLKRLASEAPGTFQHTLFVATLAEAAAKELGCNVELIRTGTLYHDIGKMHDPQGFIENQMGGPNKHDEIDDPWESAAIIKKHVSEGLVMARKFRLPKAIQAFIPEHQGTMLIAYFYHQAQQRAKQEGREVRDEEFRYDGPIPQSRETAIVMLADSCEAALRSLKDVSPEEALNMVNKILKARWQDNQLGESGLKREEMPKIAEIFVRVWQQFNHKRIAYPKAALSLQSK